MSEGPGGDNKTEQPTQHRLDKAREEGNVLRAHSVAAAAVAVAGAAILSFAGGKLTELLELCLRRGLSVGGIGSRQPVPLLAAITAIVTPGVLVIAIFLIALTLVGFLADIAVGGWSFSVKPLTADFGRLNPMSGLRRLVSPAAFAELAKALVKFAAVAVIAYLSIRSRLPGFMRAAAENWPGATGHAALLWNQVFIVLAASLAALAALEVPYQVWSHRSRLKMTRQDLKDEMRELDGSPHTKRRIRALRRRLARMRMAAEVPKADVVVTNPEHYAAALQYR